MVKNKKKNDFIVCEAKTDLKSNDVCINVHKLSTERLINVK